MKLYQNAYGASKSIDARAETRGDSGPAVSNNSICSSHPAIPRRCCCCGAARGFCDVIARAKAGHVTYAFTIRIDISSLRPFFVRFYWMVINFIFNLCVFFFVCLI